MSGADEGSAPGACRAQASVKDDRKMAETGLLTNPELFDEKWISFHTLPAAL